MKVFVLFTALVAVIKCNYYYIRSDCNPDFPCTSLDDITEEINNPHFLQFSSGTHFRQKHIHVHDVSQFIMVGNDSTIVCNGSLYYWLNFYFIHTVYVSGITFINCSGITYYSVPNLIISDTKYSGCRSTECLFIESSHSIINTVSFENTIVGYNLFMTSSVAVIFNVTMTNCNCYFSLMYSYSSTMHLYQLYSSNVSGILFEIDNGSVFIEDLHTSTYDYFLSGRCGLLNSINSTVDISNSSVVISCNALIVNQTTLFIHNSTFINDLKEQSQKYSTGLAATSSNIHVVNSTFTQFSGENGGAIEVKQKSSLVVFQSCFSHNSASIGGAVKIDSSLLKAYDTMFLKNEARLYGGAINAYNATLTLINCSLVLNKVTYFSGGGVYAWKGGLLHLNKTQFLSNSAPYGGALAIYQNTVMETTDTTFDENTGFAGGPIFIEDNCTFKSYSNLIIQNNHGGIMFIARSLILFKGNQQFRNNTGSMSISGCTVNIEGRTKISANTRYMHNTSIQIPKYVTHSHTALSVYTSTIALKGQLSILENFMGAIGCIESTVEFLGTITLIKNSAVPSSPNRDTSRGGGVAAYQCFLHYNGNVNMSNNTAIYGGGMYASTSICYFYSSETSFYFNSATMGGAIYLDLNSKLIFYYQTNGGESYNPKLKLAGNEAMNAGGAVFISDKTYFGVCSYGNNSANPEHECFIQYVNLDINAAGNTITFENNRAITGINIYGGLLNRCYVAGNHNSNGVVLFKSISAINESINSITSGPTQLCICHNNTIDCTITTAILSVFKGESITLNVTAVDQIGTSLPARIISILTSPERNSVSRVEPGQLLQELSDQCSSLKYNVYSTGATEQIRLYPEGPCIDKGISTLSLQLKFKSCPPGFQEFNGSCQCHRSLRDSTCNIDLQTITRHGSSWITYITTDNRSDLLVYTHCPYDYCRPPGDHVTINLLKEGGVDAQCGHNRTGTLCGSCMKGLSRVLGSSKCMRCNNVTVLLLLPIALVGIVLVVAMLIFNLTVEMAAFNGVILFANIVAISFNTFFPANLSTYYLTIIISWINLDLGFQTCLLDGLSTYGKVWLEILFPIYLLLLAATLLITKHKASAYWMVKIFREKNPNAVVATVILLTFTKFLILLPTLFSYAKASGESDIVWAADGNIAYGRGKHMALLIVGTALSIYVVVFTVVMLCGRSLLDASNRHVLLILNKTHLRPILDAYHAPYASSKSWPGVLVLYRVVIMLMSAYTTLGPHHKLNIALLSIATLVTAAIKDIMGVRYHHRKSAILDSSYLAAAGFLAVSLLYIKEDQSKAIASLTTTSAITIWTIAVISYHIYSTIGRILVSRQPTICCINRRQESTSESQAEARSTATASSDIIIVNTHITTSFIDTLHANN